jgi:hypothetical protein
MDTSETIDNKAEQIDVALFPIPNMVSFPGISMPLHVFEPRYRAMIKHSQDNEVMIAVTHTKKMVSKTKKKRISSDTLNQNQSTYEPHKVFSAGYCETIKTTADGRIHVLIKPEIRLKMKAITQQVPFMIATCEQLPDQIINDTQLCTDRMGEINQLLQALCKQQNPELYEIITAPEWLNQTPKDFSFQLFKYFRFEPDFMQHVLEQTTVIERLDLIWHGLRQSLEI